MAVNGTGVMVEAPCNGVTTAFAFNFKILLASDLIVRTKSALGVYSAALTLGVDYSVSFDPNAETGTVTMAVAGATGTFVNILRASNLQQGVRYPRDNNLPAKTTETAIDKLTMIAQELSAGVAPGVSAAQEAAAAAASASLAAASVANAISLFQKVGTFATLDAGAGSTFFIAQVTDLRAIMAFLGNRALGNNGWTTLGGY